MLRVSKENKEGNVALEREWSEVYAHAWGGAQVLGKRGQGEGKSTRELKGTEEEEREKV